MAQIDCGVPDANTTQPQGAASGIQPNVSPASNVQQPKNAPSTDGQPERVVPKGISFADIGKTTVLASVNNAAARMYVEELYKACSRLGLSVEAVVTGTTDAQVVYDSVARYGIALIFAGSTGIAKRPVSEKSNEVIAAFRTRHSGITIIQTFVIDESSYDRASVAAAAIYNTIHTAVDEDNDRISGESFTAGNSELHLVVSTKQDVYRDYIRRVSPFGFSMRDDIGFLVGVPNADCLPSDRFNITPETHTILFAVTGYTQFIRLENNPAQYGPNQKTIQPIVHISSIISQMPSMAMLPAAIAIAGRAFVTCRNWRKPYLIINGKETSNVGNLLLNVDPATGARSTIDAETAFQADEAMNTCCADPVLALDIVNGRDGIPGLDIILNSNVSSNKGNVVTIMDVMKRRFPTKVDLNTAGAMPVIAGTIHEYSGSVMLDNQVVDSRNADYLRMFRRIGDYGQVAMMLCQPNDPALRLQQLQDYGYDVKALYDIHCPILTFAFVQFMNSLCPRYDIDLTNDARFNYAFNGIENGHGLNNINWQGGFTSFNQPGGYNSAFDGRWLNYR